MTRGLILVLALAGCTSSRLVGCTPSREEPEGEPRPFECADGSPNSNQCFIWALECVAWTNVLGGECVPRSEAWCVWSDEEGRMECYADHRECERWHRFRNPGVGPSCALFKDPRILEHRRRVFPGEATGLR